MADKELDDWDDNPDWSEYPSTPPRHGGAVDYHQGKAWTLTKGYGRSVGNFRWDITELGATPHRTRWSREGSDRPDLPAPHADL
jgi:alpha-L-fucosidase